MPGIYACYQRRNEAGYYYFYMHQVISSQEKCSVLCFKNERYYGSGRWGKHVWENVS